MSAWIVFLISGSVVAAAGARLARDGNVIAERTGLGGMWVGAILLAAATSLPELVTAINAVLRDYTGLAVGELLGSSMANMLILALADLLSRESRILTRVAINQAMVGTLAICLTAMAGIGLLAPDQSIIGVGWPTVAIALVYVAGTRLLHRNRAEPPFRATTAEPLIPTRQALRGAGVGFAISAVAILAAGPYLAGAAGTLSAQLGISQGFAGMVFLAITTSLPEASVSVAAVRRGAYDLAVGNLLGSNCFNMALLVPLDIVQGSGSILASAGLGLALAAFCGVILMTIALLDVLNKSERRIWVFEPGPAIMVFVYFAGLYLVFRSG